MLLKKSFKTRLTAIFFIAVIIPITLLGVLAYNDIYKYLIVQQNQGTLKNIINDTSLIDSAFTSKVNILKSLAISLGYEIMEIDDEARINQYLYEQKRSIGEGFLNLYITRKDGKTYDANFWAKDFIHVDLRKREWYLGAEKRKDIYFSKPYRDIVTGHSVMTIAVPVENKEGNFLGVLAVDFLFDNIIQQVNKINMNDKAFHIMVDDGGNIIYDGSGFNNIEYGTFIKNPEKLIKLEYKNKEIIGSYTSLDSIKMGVITFQNIEDYYKQINQFLWSYVIVYGLMIALIFLSIVHMSKKVSMPVMQLKKGVRRILDGNYDTTLPVSADDDFGELMTSFNSMADTIKDNYDNLAEQSRELFEQNELLQETYAELEASYEQLQATMEQLNYSETKYKTLIENISDLIWVMTPEGKIIYINDSVKEMLGYDPNELIGKDIFTIMCPLHKYEACDDIVEEFRKRDFRDFDLWFVKAEGEERIIISANINRIFLDGKLVSIHGIGRDVTQKRKLEDRILKKNRELEILNKISNILTAKSEMDDLLSAIVEKIHELLNIELCSIRLLKNEKLQLKASSGELKDLMVKDSINIYEDIIGKSVLEKRIVILQDVEETGTYKRHEAFFSMIGKLNTLIFIPLKLHDDIIGVLTVASLKGFDEIEISILESFSNHAAVTIEKARLYQNLKDAYFKTIKTLATAVEAKDSYTEGHSLRVAKYSTIIAKQLGLGDERIEEIYTAGILHDIGKIGIDDAILTKPGRLSEEEYLAITKHPTIGQRILSHIGLSRNILDGVLLHHKRYDLRGYPKDVEINDLPLEARIIGVADAFDAITTTRSYSEARTIEEALDELRRNKGTQFCPEIVEVVQYICQNNRNELEAVIKQ